MARILSKVAIVVLIAGIIFAWIGHFARVGSTTRELTDLRKERLKYEERTQEDYQEHLEFYNAHSEWEHDPEDCETCGSRAETLKSYSDQQKSLEEAQTSILMDTLGSCLWYVIGCGILFCLSKPAQTEEDE